MQQSNKQRNDDDGNGMDAKVRRSIGNGTDEQQATASIGGGEK